MVCFCRKFQKTCFYFLKLCFKVINNTKLKMADTVATSPAIVAEKKPKKAAAASGSKKPKSAPTHPPTQQMVDAAIKTLKDRGGSSLLAIKKYIAATYKVDVQKLAPFIKKYLKGAVISGKLVQTKGKGAAGSFKLSPSANKEPKAKSAEKKKSAAKPKAAAAGDKKLKKVSGEKKVKKVAATTKKSASADKKKVEKPKVKSVKKTSAVKAKPTKAKAAAPKPKVPKAKSATAAAAKPKKAVAVKKAKK